MENTRLLFFVSLLFCSHAFGAGFGLYQGTAAGTTDPTTGIAKGGEPGALFLNPAALTSVPGDQIQFGVIAVAPNLTFKGENPYTHEPASQAAKSKVWPIPHAYATHQINDEWWIGLGLYTRFGLGADWGQKWFGRYNIYDVSMLSFNIGPTVAWKANDWLSLAAGFNVQYFDITLNQKIDVAGKSGLRRPNDPSPSPFDVDQSLAGDAIDLGIDLGLMIHPADRWNFGLGYHSQIRQTIKGEATYRKPSAIQQAVPNLFESGPIQSTLTLPDVIFSALTFDATEDLTLGFGLTCTTWSTYDELKIYFEDPRSIGAEKKASPKEWHDSFRYTFGMTYRYTSALTLRASYTYDQSPMKESCLDYIVPGDDRHIIALGTGYTTGNWTFDLAYFYELVENQSVNPNLAAGIHPAKAVDGNAHSFGFSVSRKF